MDWPLPISGESYLSNKMGGVLFRVGPLGHDAVKEFSAGDQFHYQVDTVLLLVRVVQLDNVRVAESETTEMSPSPRVDSLPQDFDLVLQGLLLALEGLLVDAFDGDDLARLALDVGQIDLKISLG